MRAFILTALALVSVARAERWQHLSAYNYVNSIVQYNTLLYIGSRGGLLVYDFLLHDLKYSLVLSDGADLVTPDLMSNDIFYVTGGNLYRWNPFTESPDQIADVGMVRSLGTGTDYVYVDKSGTIRHYSKMGTYMGQGGAPADVIWSGERGELDREDVGVLFLAPFFKQTRNLGRVDETVFYRTSWRLWVGTWGDGVTLFDANLELPMDSLKLGINPGAIKAIYARENEIWVGGDEGFTQYKDDRWTEYSREGDFSIACTGIVDITGDSQRIWFATECGVMKFENDRFWSYRMPPGLSNWLTSCHMDDRTLWLGTDDGVAYMPEGTGEISPVTQTEGIYVNWIGSNRDRVYFATDRGVIYFKKKEEEWGSMVDRRGWTDSDVESAFIRGDTLFFSTSYGILSIHEADTSYIAPPFDAVGQPILSLALLDPILFIGTPRGLYAYDLDAHSWTQYTHFQGLMDYYIYSLMAHAENNSIYIGTRDGLSILTP